MEAHRRGSLELLTPHTFANGLGPMTCSPLRVPPALQNSVGDSVLYRAGQAYMARRDYTPTALLDQLDTRRADVFPEPNYYLFDLRVRHRKPTITIHARLFSPANCFFLRLRAGEPIRRRRGCLR